MIIYKKICISEGVRMGDNQIYPYIAIVIGVISLSTAAVFVKLAGDVPPSIIANYRLLLAAFLMLPYVVVKKKTGNKNAKKRRNGF